MKYTVKHTTIIRDNVKYHPGSSIELPDDEAGRLARYLDPLPDFPSGASLESIDNPVTDIEQVSEANPEPIDNPVPEIDQDVDKKKEEAEQPPEESNQ